MKTVEILTRRAPLLAEASAALAALADAAVALGRSETAKQLQAIGARLRAETNAVIVTGRYRNGKSTLANALLGPSGYGDRPLPTDLLPCTAVLTRVRYADQPTARLWRFDGRHEDWSFARYLRESTIKETEEATHQFFGEIREFEVGYPAELCKAGVAVLDSPGLDDIPERTAVTEAAVRESDAVIVVFRSDTIAGQGEREFVQQHILATGTRVFTVVNLWAGMVPTPRFLEFTWNRLIRDLHGGSAYSGQAIEDFAAQGIYFVDVRQAVAGRFAGDATLVAASGLGALEQDLGEFLLRERTFVHLGKSAHAALRASAELEAAICEDTQRHSEQLARLNGLAGPLAASRGTLRGIDNTANLLA